MAVFLQRGRAMSWRHLHRIEIQGEIERALSDAAAALAAHTGAGVHGAYYTPGKSGCRGGGSDAATPRRRPRPSSDLFRVFAAPAPAPTTAPTTAAATGPGRPPPLQWVPDALGRRDDGDSDGAAEAAARRRTRGGGRGGERGHGGAAAAEAGSAAGCAEGGAAGGAAAAGKARSRALFPLQIPQAAGMRGDGDGASHGLHRRVTPAPPATGREAAQWQTGQAPREAVAPPQTAVTGRLRAAFSGWGVSDERRV